MQIATMKLGNHEGRSITVQEPSRIQLANGKTLFSAMPRLVQLDLRPASSAPEGTRLKMVLTIDVGADKRMPLPVAQATVLPLPIPAFVVETRLEMN